MGFFWNKVEKWQKSRRPTCAMIVAAAGSSVRMGGENKMLIHLGGMPVLMRTLLAIDRAETVDEIVVATREELLLEVADICAHAGIRKPVKVVKGGQTRTESVLAAAMECDPKTELIAVHDGARPLVLPEMIDEMVRLGAKTYAAAPAVSLNDTVKVADENGLVKSTPDRSSLYAVQTPQVFQADILKAALQAVRNSGEAVTDDCAAVERLGKEVYLTDGDRENIKITTPMDLTVAEAILRQRGEIR